MAKPDTDAAPSALPPAAGILEAGRHCLPIRVYYEDTDAGGIVYHASYLRFFERGRTEFVRALGIDQSDFVLTTGIVFVVRRMEIDFLRPARLDDTVIVESLAQALGGSSVTMRQRLWRGSDLLTQAQVSVVCVREGRPVRMPEQVRAAIAAGAPIEGAGGAV